MDPKKVTIPKPTEADTEALQERLNTDPAFASLFLEVVKLGARLDALLDLFRPKKQTGLVVPQMQVRRDLK